MNPTQPFQNSQTVIAPQQQNLVMSLGSGSIGINSVQIYNDTNGVVSLFVGGAGTAGSAQYAIPPNGSVTVNPGGQNYITATCTGTTGYYTATWTDQWLVAMATNIPTVPPNTQYLNLVSDDNQFNAVQLTDPIWGTVAAYELNGQGSPAGVGCTLISANPTLYVQRLWATGLPPYIVMGIGAYFSSSTPNPGFFSLFTLGETGVLEFPQGNPLALDVVAGTAGSVKHIMAFFANYDSLAQIQNKGALCGFSGYFQ